MAVTQEATDFAFVLHSLIERSGIHDEQTTNDYKSAVDRFLGITPDEDNDDDTDAGTEPVAESAAADPAPAPAATQ